MKRVKLQVNGPTAHDAGGCRRAKLRSRSHDRPLKADKRLRHAPSGRTLVGMNPAEKRHLVQLLTEATLAVEEAEAALESARAHRARVARVAMDSQYFTFKAVAEALGMTPVGLRKSLSSRPDAKG